MHRLLLQGIAHMACLIWQVGVKSVGHRLKIFAALQ